MKWTIPGKLEDRVKNGDKWSEGGTKRLVTTAAERIVYLQGQVAKKRTQSIAANHVTADLLAALEQMLSEHDAWSGFNDDGFDDATIANARAAIAKAKGES